MTYKENDNELLYLINEDSDYYRYILFSKYRTVIYSIVNDYYNRYSGLNIDYDDLLQEGMIGFNNAINYYNSNSSIFYTFASLCIKRAITSYIRKCYLKKNIIYNDMIEDKYLDNLMVFDDDVFISKYYEYEFVNLKNCLNLEESLVFELKYNGFTIKEISNLLDYSMSKINKLICKIKFNLEKTG